MSTDQEYKVRENRARRAAQRQGLTLRKNPRRDARAADYGSYMLVHEDSGACAADFGWDHVGFPDRADWLAEVEAYLDRERRRDGNDRSGTRPAEQSERPRT